MLKSLWDNNSWINSAILYLGKSLLSSARFLTSSSFILAGGLRNGRANAAIIVTLPPMITHAHAVAMEQVKFLDEAAVHGLQLDFCLQGQSILIVRKSPSHTVDHHH